MSKDFNPHENRRVEVDVHAFSRLYKLGAYLIRCTPKKTPVDKVKDSDGNIIRTPWPDLERHIRSGGHVGYYAPGRQGLMVLDFDPINDTYKDQIEDILGPSYSWWYSSGKWKPAKDGKPEGYGGHVLWRVGVLDGTYQRNFSLSHTGPSLGEVFSLDDGFQFIVYNPTDLVDCIDSGEENDVGCDIIRKLPIGKPQRGKSTKYSSDWKPDPNTRHGSCYLACASASKQLKDSVEFSAALDDIREKFINAFSPEETAKRDVAFEFKRIEERAWEFFENDRKREEVADLAAQGIISHNSDPRLKEILDRAFSLSTKETIGLMASASDARSRPEKLAESEIRRLANKIHIPDSIALHDVECLLDAAFIMSQGRIEESYLQGVYSEYNNEWRHNYKVKMACGDFPLVMNSIGKFYSSIDDLREAIRNAGGVPMPGSFQCSTSDEVMTAIRATGVKVVWSELDTAITLQHDDVSEWKLPKQCTPPDFTPIMQLQKGILRSVLATRRKVEENANGAKTVKFYASPVMRTEMVARTFISKMFGQIGHEIPRIDYTIEFTKKLIEKRNSMTDAEREECVRLASNWLLLIPSIKVVDEEKNRPLAQCASKIVYTVFMKRRLQFMGESVRPYSQRTVPVFGGKRRAGKTTIAKHLFPTDGVFTRRIELGFAFNNDDNQMKRLVNGKLLVIADELQGLSSTKKDIVKSFITWSDGEYHKKHQNYEPMVRSDVLVGTTNQSNEVPSDSALKDRLLFVHIEKAEGFTDKERHANIIEWLENHHDQLMIGGLIMAERNEDLNPPEEIEDLRSDVTIELDSSNNQFFDTIRSLIEEGTYSKMTAEGEHIISICLVALKAGLLTYKRDVYNSADERVHSRGDIIRLEDGVDDEFFEWSTDVQEAFKSRSNERTSTGAITQLREAIKTMCGEHSLDNRYQPPWVNGERGGKFRGFNVNQCRLAHLWNSNPEDTDED